MIEFDSIADKEGALKKENSEIYSIIRVCVYNMIEFLEITY